MNIDFINTIIKINFMILIVFYIYNKLTKSDIKNIWFIIFSTIITTIIYMLVKIYGNSFLAIMSMYITISVLISKNIKRGIANTMIAVLICFAICLIFMVISVIIAFIFNEITLKINLSEVTYLFLIIFIETILIFMFFKVKRFSNGFSFLIDNGKKEYLDVIIINISAVVMLAYCLFGDFYGDVTKQILITFIIVSIIMIVMIQKTLTLYYKQKLLHQTIEDYKNEISEKDKKIKELSEEKYKISKLNHEFYNRQKALEKKVADYISNVNVETANELAITEQIADLSKEYSSKLEDIKHPDKLPTTEIEEIDDMFKYMQSECEKNKIELKLQINGNIHHMINQIIPKDKLVTLIGDHLRDAIIAINSSNNSFRSIIAILGKADEYYEFCVFDTGIEFELETLLALGTKPITTHKDTGGTGYGFMTTFETLRETKGSLVIEEKHKMSENNYTKAVRIIFDGKAQYRISSYRMKEQNKSIL